jgi:KDO2-lipid IV(A) lauroyltransferase
MNPRELCEAAATAIGSRAVHWISEERADALAQRAARCWFARGGARVGFALKNLRVAFPELDEAQRREIGRSSYVHFARNLAEWLRSLDWGPEELLARVSFEGLEHGHAALAQGRGALVLSLHMGNFELAIRTAPLLGIPSTATGRPMANPKLWEWVSRGRRATGAELIDVRGGAPEILRALRANRMVAVMIDQYSRRTRAVLAPLFGVRCHTSAGIATLALRSGAPVLPLYVVREGPARHRAVMLPPIPMPDTGDRKADIEAGTARCNEVIESVIRKHPDQWWWAHRRFRNSPDLPELEY